MISRKGTKDFRRGKRELIYKWQSWTSLRISEKVNHLHNHKHKLS